MYVGTRRASSPTPFWRSATTCAASICQRLSSEPEQNEYIQRQHTSPSNVRGINTEIEISSSPPSAEPVAFAPTPPLSRCLLFSTWPRSRGCRVYPARWRPHLFSINKWRPAPSLLTASKSITVAAETIETLGIETFFVMIHCQNALWEEKWLVFVGAIVVERVVGADQCYHLVHRPHIPGHLRERI